MNQPPRSDDDVRLSEEQIQALSQGLRQQYMPTDRNVAGTVGRVVVNNFEALIRRLLHVFRLPLIFLAALTGFLLVNGREGVSFGVAIAAAVIAGVAGAALQAGLIRLIDMRAYRREIGH